MMFYPILYTRVFNPTISYTPPYLCRPGQHFSNVSNSRKQNKPNSTHARIPVVVLWLSTVS